MRPISDLKRSFLLPSLVTGLVLWSMPARSQDTGGGLAGKVLDADGAPISYVSVVVRGPALQGTRGTLTMKDGSFRVLPLPLGAYELELKHVGYHDLKVEDVRILLGRITALGELSLTMRVHEMETIVVRAPALATDPVRTTMASNITSEELERLPVGREIEDALIMAPQSNESYYHRVDRGNIAGSTGPDVMYFLDGNNITHPGVGGNRMEIPWNFLQEIQVVEGGYQAEYGRGVSGIVNLVTHRGSNQLFGGAFAFMTGDQLTGEPKQGIAESTGDNVFEYDLGLGLGGPLLTDKLWFFAAYNQERAREDADFFGLGTFRLEGRSHRYLGTLTWRILDGTEAEGTVFGNVYRTEYIGTPLYHPPSSLEEIDCLLQKAEREPVSASLALRHRFSEETQLEATVALYDHGVWVGGATPRGRSEPLFIDWSTGAYSGGNGVEWDSAFRRTSGRLHGRTVLGSHSFKAGVEYERNAADQSLERTTIHASGGLYQVHRSSAPLHNATQIATAFVQDSWEIHPQLRFNLGVRWEGQYLGTKDDVVVSIPDQWQPRMGFVLHPIARSNGRIFGSYGRYYAQSVTNAIGVLGNPERRSIEYYSEDPRLPTSTPDSTTGFGAGLDPIVDTTPMGEHYDEWTLGAEWILGSANRITVRGMYRDLRATLLAVTDYATELRYFGNPGEGAMAGIPRHRRDYRAVELSFERRFGTSTAGALHYVLSQSRGNYPGMYDAYFNSIPAGSSWIAHPGHATIGPLPNDRPHVVKLRASHATGFGLTGGLFFTWQSGTPVNEIIDYWEELEFIGGRGGAGRLPSIWDVSLRFSYELGIPVRALRAGRLILDILHIGNPREVVVRDEMRGKDWGDGFEENPAFGRAVYYQPPTTLRLGLEISL